MARLVLYHLVHALAFGHFGSNIPEYKRLIDNAHEYREEAVTAEKGARGYEAYLSVDAGECKLDLDSSRSGKSLLADAALQETNTYGLWQI